MDTIAPARRSENMRRIRSKDTAAEMTVRRVVHSLGYRFRLHDRNLPGRPDLVFSGRRKVIFVHGCFWHQHPDRTCRIVREATCKQGYWVDKLEGNKTRDGSQMSALRQTGWDVLVVWECEAEGDRGLLVSRLRLFLG